METPHRTGLRAEVALGSCRATLEEWLDSMDLDAPALIGHARVLADQVDRDPASSALHGRYQDALSALVDAAGRAGTVPDDEVALRAILAGLACDRHPTATMSCSVCGGRPRDVTGPTS